MTFHPKHLTSYEAPPTRSMLVAMGAALVMALWVMAYQDVQLRTDIDHAQAGLEVLRAKVATLEASR
jgi:type II secretory pathway component PulM